jgi:predicted NAD-dependent protein-ADP-ribosyltransferase YbiA (DUF1768 family)
MKKYVLAKKVVNQFDEDKYEIIHEADNLKEVAYLGKMLQMLNPDETYVIGVKHEMCLN